MKTIVVPARTLDHKERKDLEVMFDRLRTFAKQGEYKAVIARAIPRRPKS